MEMVQNHVSDIPHDYSLLMYTGNEPSLKVCPYFPPKVHLKLDQLEISVIYQGIRQRTVQLN